MEEVRTGCPVRDVQRRNGRKPGDIILKEEDQPSSLEIQLLFQRAGVYLTIACKHVFESLSSQVTTSQDQMPKSSSAPSGDAVAEFMTNIQLLISSIREAGPPSGDGTADFTSELRDLASGIEDLTNTLQGSSAETSLGTAEPLKDMLLGNAVLDKQQFEAKIKALATALQELTNPSKAPLPALPAVEPDTKQLAARKMVRLNAKRALRDYNQYLSHFEYSPDLPIEIAEEFARKVNYASNGVKAPRSYPHSQGVPEMGDASTKMPHRVYKLSELFAATPPAGLPPYPSTAMTVARPQHPEPQEAFQTTTETLSYHPLLTDALHSLLLCHCLIQTSPKELLRHAYMVARLVRLADGYPVFQASRSPARADWIDVIQRGENWIKLSEAWENLCAPAPLPLFQSYGNGTAPVPMPPTPALPLPPRAIQKAILLKPESPISSPTETDEADSDKAQVFATKFPDQFPDPFDSLKDEELDQELVKKIRLHTGFGIPEDERIADEPSYCIAVRARQSMAEHNYQLDNAVARMDAQLVHMEGLVNGQDTLSDGTPRNGTALGNGDLIVDATANGKVSGEANSGAAYKAAANGSAPANGKGRERPSISGARRWSGDDRNEYLILTERAVAVARWVCEAPGNAGSAAGEGKKRKKKPAKKTGAAVAASVNGGEAGAEAEDEGRETS